MELNQNYFVIFPPGTGGHHFANMLSLGKEFTTRFKEFEYERPTAFDNLYGPYTSPFQLYDLDKVNSDHLEILGDQNNVFSGHWLSYNKFKKSGLVKCFPNRTFFSIQIPDPNSKFFPRFQKLSLGSYKVGWLLNEMESVYKCDNLALMCEEPLTKFYYVWPDLLLERDFNVILKDLQKQGFNTELDMELVQTLHGKWLDNLAKEEAL